MSFEGKVVIVTGSSSGIGAAAAESFCREGASVTLVGRKEAKLKAVAAKCAAAGGKHIVIRADVSHDDDAKRIVSETIKAFGQLDVLVNNAAIMLQDKIADGSVLQTFDRQVNGNLRAVIHLTSLATPHLVKTKGNVVNISSAVATKVTPGATAYSILKAALNHYSRSAAAEFAASGVRVNTISPGPVVTDLMENGGFSYTEEELRKFTILNRVSASEEIADLILYVASDKARGITGSTFLADNGYNLL